MDVKYSFISKMKTILFYYPGSEIGKHCLVAANSTVNGTFDDDTFISGSPAKAVGKLSKMPFFNTNNKRHYPWPHNFSRGLPWSEIGFEKWKIENNYD